MRQWLKNLFARKPSAARDSRFRPTLEALGERLVPATFTVTNLDNAGTGSLRQAVLSANASAGADLITFQEGLTGTIALTSGQLEIKGALTIQGPGADVLAVSGNNASRLFLANNGTTWAVSGLTLTNGKPTNTSASFNTHGGAIVNVGNLTLTDCTVSGNAGGLGGAIYNISGTVALTNCTVSGNSARLDGGGICSEENGTVTLTNCTVSGNSAGNGGGLAILSGTMKLTNCTLSGNSATALGGGLYTILSATTTLTNCTVSDNAAPDGGGILAHRQLALNNTIVANSASGGDLVLYLGTETILSGSNNLIEDGSGGLADTLTGDPFLGPLQDNGGPTWTHALLPGSPAQNAGRNALAVDPTGNPIASDQRGFAPRIVNGTVDIGAVEVGAASQLPQPALPAPPPLPPAPPAPPQPAFSSAQMVGNTLVVTGAGVPDGAQALPLPVGSLAFFADLTGDARGDVILFLPSLTLVLDGQTGRLLALDADDNGDGARDLKLFNPDGTTTRTDGRTGGTFVF